MAERPRGGPGAGAPLVSGYTPIFRTVFDGTLHGKWPQTGVWLALLAMADRHGHIDRSPQAIASDIGIGVDDLMACIGEFSEPDLMSRTRESDGRRLELLDPERPWGWRVINHGKYREKARKAAYDADRTQSGADAERKRAARAVPTRPAPSRAVPLSDSDSDSDTNKNSEKEGEGAAAPRARPAKKSAGSRIPEGWRPSPACRAYAEKMLPRVDTEALIGAFVDHWTAAVGPKALKADWDATWRTWVRRSNGYGYPMLTGAANHAPQIRIDANGRRIGGPIS
jgi:hypothetical protein